MMDELQQAYSAYQQALYHLVDPKVCSSQSVSDRYVFLPIMLGAKTMVWYRHTLRPLWLA